MSGMAAATVCVTGHLTGVLPSRQCHYRLPAGTLLAEGERCDGLAPYRLISLDGCWYLTGELNGHITVHPLATIHAVTVLNTTFTPRKRLSQLTTQAGFIRALPHFSCIREVLTPGPSEEEPDNTLI